MKMTVLTVMIMMQASILLAMTDTAAMAQAKAIWGAQARIQKVRTAVTSETAWRYQVGCAITSNPRATVIVGEGATWEAALAEAAGKPQLEGTVNTAITGSTASTGQDTFQCDRLPVAAAKGK